MKIARSMTLLALVLTLSQPAAAHHIPIHAQCTPIFYSFHPGGFYDLLNDPDFTGTHPSCTTWDQATVVSSSACSNSNSAELLPAGLSTYQDFTVPSTTSGTLELGVEFATIGTPASTLDRLVFDLYEGGVHRERQTIYTKNSPFYCHRETLYFTKYDYSGRNLRLSMRALYGTPGVTYHINWAQLFAYLY